MEGESAYVQNLRGKDEATLKDMFDSCVIFEERCKIRNALREVQGLNRQWNGGIIKPLSFRPRNVKSEPSSVLKQPSTATKRSQKVIHLSLKKEDERRIELQHIAWRQSLSDNIPESETEIKSAEKRSLVFNRGPENAYELVKGEQAEKQQPPTESKSQEVVDKDLIQEENSSITESPRTDDDDDVNSVFGSVSTPQNDSKFVGFSHGEILTVSSPQEINDNEVFSQNNTFDGGNSFQFHTSELSPIGISKEETLKNKQNKPCKFLSRGKITSDIPKHSSKTICNVSNSTIKSDTECSNRSEEMEGPAKSYRSQLIIGSIGNSKDAKSSCDSHVFTNGNHGDISQGQNSGHVPIKPFNSLKVLKTNKHDGGTVITEAIRRKSLDNSLLTNGLSLLQVKDSGTVITEEMRRKSVDQSWLSSEGKTFDKIENNEVNTKEVRNPSNTDRKTKRENESGTIITEEIRRRSLDSCSLKINKIDNRRNSSDNNKVAALNQNLGSNDKHVNIQEVQSQGKTTEVITVHNSSEESNCIDKQEDMSVIEDTNTVLITIAKDDGGCSDCQKNQETSIDGALQCNTEEEFTLQLQALRTKLKESTDFTHRRKIRGKIRKLREQMEAFDIRRKPVPNQFLDNCTRTNGITRELTTSNTENCTSQDYSKVDSKDELRKLLSQTNDYEEKKQIRLALRQLRQRDRERESGNTRSGPTACLTRSQSVKEFNNTNQQTTTRPRIVRCVSEIGNSDKVLNELQTHIECKPLQNGYSNIIEDETGDNHVCANPDLRNSGSSENSGRQTPENLISRNSDSDENSLPSPLRRSFSLNSIRKKRSEKDISVTPSNSSNHKSVRTNSPESCSSSSEFSEHSRENLQHSTVNNSKHSKNGNSSQSLKHSDNSLSDHNFVNPLKHSKDTDKNRRSSVPASAKPFKDLDDHRSGSESDSSSCRDWLENKRRYSLTVIDTKKLNSTMDIEAAFSEILNAVDTEEENNVEEDTPELEIMEVDGQEKISIKTPRNVCGKPITTVDVNFNNNEVKPVCTGNDENSEKIEKVAEETETQITPVRKKPVFTLAPLTPLNNTLSIIEDDDGSITVQSESYKDQGDHTVTEKTTLRRSQSRTEEEEKDTVIESKLTSPGGSDHFEKDVIKTKRKITSRGSDYFSRSQYKTKWLRNKEGETIEEHDVMVESDNFSVTKGQSWGDRSEAKVQLNKQTNQIPNVVPEIQETANHDSGENRLKVHGLNRMDVSKASSGYGSVSGSDEEEKEEGVVTALQGKPSGSPEVKAPLKDLVALEGSNAVLECIATCSPTPDITWYKGDKSLMNSRHFEHKYDSISGRATLTVLNSSKDDSGPYKCIFRNPLGEAETKAALTVRSRAKKKPMFTKALENMAATEGHSVCLECAVNDATQVAWYKDGIIQRNTSDFKQTFDGLNAKLEIDEIFVDDHGEYACVAKNDFGENKTTCRINVKETACETDVVPMFLTKPESKIHECNDTIALQCDVIGSPQPTIKWCHDQTTVEDSTRHKQKFDGRTAHLFITKATIEDSGKYECIAINTSGKVSVDALIVVKAKQASPEILRPLSDETVICGKSLALKCDVKGNPCPMIVWRKDSRIIGNTKDFRQTYQDVTAKLQINDVHKEDSGCYECVARNVYGAVSTKCSVVVEGTNSESSGAEEKSKKPLDWLVGRDKNEPIIRNNKPNETSVKRSESMKVTSNYSLRDKYRKTTLGNLNTDTSNLIQEVVVEPQNKVSVTKDTTDQKTDNDVKVDINMNKTKFEDPLKQKMAMARSKGPEDPPWKNVTLRRTESARVLVGRKESPFLRKRKEELAEKMDGGSPIQNNEDPTKLATKPPGWRPVMSDKDEPDVKKENEILSSLRQVNLRRSDSARCVRGEAKQINFGANNIERDSGSKTDNYKANKQNEEETPKVGQTSSTRLLFERKFESSNSAQQPKDTPLTNFLNRPGNGLRRTSSLKITQAERDSGTRPLVHSRMSSGLDIEHNKGTKTSDRRFVNKEGDQNTTITMPTYDNIDDEEELHKILSKTDDFEERKKIRNRMRELREVRSKQLDVKRLEQEKEREDIFKKRFQSAEEEQKRQMKAFEKAAQESKEERERILKVKDDLLKDSMKAQDESKKRHLQAFDKMAQKGGEGVVKQQSGFGGASYSKTPEQAAKFLSDKLVNAGSPVIGGKITIRTEAWNSQDGVTNKSEKTETWGAQPTGAKGAMNKFKSMEPAGVAPAKPNGLIAVSLAKRAAKTMQRNVVAIKQDILHFVKTNTEGYENVEVTNFSSSWNNGMAFCALIHHFYPDSFDFSRLDPKKRRANFTLAFDIAEKHADIAPLLDVDDMVKMQKPDWKCVFTYVQSFYRKLNDHPRNSAAAPKPEQ